ncbi:MAG TPA: TonB-dependent receptor plug domain-containing protein, partial [Flavisolibacter sp.]|nr:TonB-dependent receptor plug domain-containing protein [Flavisolibacter sp.]
MKNRNQVVRSILLWLTGFCLLFLPLQSLAQDDGEIVGTIQTENGAALDNVAVVARIEGSSASVTAITDVNGIFRLKNLEPDQNYTLTISSIGFETQVMKGIKALKNFKSFTVRLKESSSTLNNVVVTALGIKREERVLGFSATTLKGEELTNAVSGNWTDALSGKVAGLNLIRSNAGPTGSNKIILRGENNLNGDNEALIVVDGVVINQSSGRRNGVSGEVPYGVGSENMPADYGSGLNDINPEDIESITVLKGPGASALYGQRGANGAVIITTKSGSSKRKGWGITLNSNASIEQVNRWPDLQYEYGQGLDGMAYYSYGTSPDGASTSATSSAYGPRFNGQMFYQYDPVKQGQGAERTPWVPYRNKSREYFNSGQTYTNTISVDGGTDKTSA